MVRIIGIDPAKVTGIVGLDLEGNVLFERELSGVSGGQQEYKMASLMFEIKNYLKPDDLVGVEDFAREAFDPNKVTSGTNWSARLTVAMSTNYRSAYAYPGPGQIKKFLQVSEWKGRPKKANDPGSGKTRLSTDEVKEAIKKAAEELFNYPALISHNTADALTIAHITRLVYLRRNGLLDPASLPLHQFEVVMSVDDEKEYKRYEKEKEENEKQQRAANARARKAAGAKKKSGKAEESPTLF